MTNKEYIKRFDDLDSKLHELSGKLAAMSVNYERIIRCLEQLIDQTAPIAALKATRKTDSDKYEAEAKDSMFLFKR
jgi:hypothetical protein